MSEDVRKKAIGYFEDAIGDYYEGKCEQAAGKFQKIAEDYREVIDVAAKARQYMSFCRQEKEDVAGEEEEVLEERIQCPLCHASLPVDRKFLTVWCPHCEEYVSAREEYTAEDVSGQLKEGDRNAQG